MPNLLLLLDIDVEVAHHDDASLGADVLLASAELAGGHIALHDVDAIFLVERNAGDLVEANNVVLADEAALAGGVVVLVTKATLKPSMNIPCIST
jgi:hypothetical protein